ncbi:labd-13Z-ene-9,15,16-triol synthase, chloroplastic-like [Hevea brasiliensis]|nr:labd-13Z-ene-9,15,16-triol synthase, chloroplastic-like [Hevea brasiliensis]
MPICNLSGTSCGRWSSWMCKDKELPPVLIIASISILGTCLLVWVSKTARGKAQLPPGPRGFPILGYLPFLGPNLHQLFMELAQNYGPIYKLSIGQKLCVIISSPTLVKEIVRHQDVTFANRNPTIAAKTFSYGGKDIAFAPYGPSGACYAKYSCARCRAMQILMHFILLGEARDVFGWKPRPGRDIDIGAKFRVAVAELVEILGKPNVSDFFPFLARFDIQGVKRKMEEVSQRIEKIYDHVIDQCIKKKQQQSGEMEITDRKDFLHFLLEFKEQDTEKSISRQQIKALLMDIVIGGIDTSPTTVEWAMAEMMLHPQVMKKAQEELTNVVGINNLVEEFHIQELPYLHSIVKETLRLHPVAPLLLPRCPTESCNVGGYIIPKGTKVFLNVWAMHRDPEFWDHPSEFQPERFFGPRRLDYLGNHLQYLPFGSGRRICVGLPLGERMVMYLLATFLHMFNWKLPGGANPDTSEKLGIVLEKSTPLVIIPTPRLFNLELYT